MRGPTAFRFDAETAEIDLGSTGEFAGPPIVGSTLFLSWSAGASDASAHVALIIGGIRGEGIFALADLTATACGCQAGFVTDFPDDPHCVVRSDDGRDQVLEAICEAPEGELEVHQLEAACAEEQPNLCAARQAFELRIPERSGASLSADITVRWNDRIDEQTCTGSPLGPVG